MLISHKHHNGAKDENEPSQRGDVINHVQNHENRGTEHLNKEALWQGVKRVAGGEAEDVVVGDDEEGKQQQGQDVGVSVQPQEHVTQVIAGRRESAIEMDIEPREHVIDITQAFTIVQPDHAMDGTREEVDNHTEHGNNGQHLNGRETHLPLAANVVANEVAGTQKQLSQRIKQRAVVHAPHLGNALAHTAPSDGAQSGLLGAIGTEISHKVMPTISAMLRVMGSELVIVRGMLPLPESSICCFDIHC